MPQAPERFSLSLGVALWDIKGKALGVPVYKLLGGAVKDHITPYASLLPTGRTQSEYFASFAGEIASSPCDGFCRREIGNLHQRSLRHNALQERDEAIIEMVAACRQAVGAHFVLMVDVAELARR